MAKTTITDWDTTAGNNTDIGGVNIAEGCPPSGINNAMRETMAQIASALADGTIIGSGAMPGHLFGLTLSNGTDTDHDIDIAIGSAATDDTTPVKMQLSTATTKQLDAAWAAGTNAGGLDTGSIAASTWYHVWLIQRSDTGVVDALFSTSATSPTMPTNYDRKRRIGAFLTDGSANIRAFLQKGDHFYYESPITDISVSNGSCPTSATTFTSSTPLGVETKAILNVGTGFRRDNITYQYVNIWHPDLPDQAIDTSGRSDAGHGTGASFTTYNTQRVVNAREVWTNTSSQLKYICATATTGAEAKIVTTGWIDRRGKDSM